MYVIYFKINIHPPSLIMNNNIGVILGHYYDFI